MEDNTIYFDYNHPEHILDTAKELDDILTKNGFPVFLNAGTLLGCARSNDLLPHDDDIDLFYISKKTHRKAVLNEFEQVIRPILEKDNWIIKQILWKLNGDQIMLGQYHVIKNNISMDLWMGWFNDKGRLNVTMAIEDAPIYKEDLFPPSEGIIRDYNFSIPNNTKLHLSELYGKDWIIPDPNYKIPCNHNFLQKTMLKVIDQFGWAYYFIAKEQQKYSYQKINYKKIGNMDNYNINEDVVYFHSPGMAHSLINRLINRIDKNKTKIIGGYGGETPLKYNYADLILTISFPYLNDLKKMYPDKPVIFLPEAIDTEYFNAQRRTRKSFKVGYVGRPCKVKRMHLLDKLDFDVETHTEWGPKYFVERRTLDSVKDFYKSIDCLVLTSQSECMPRVVLEAMSMGLPVVSTDVGCLRMLIEPEWIVPNSSEEDIVKNINDRLSILKKYSSIRKEVGKRNRKQIEKHFGWEQVQQKWDDVTNALVVNDFDKIKQIGKEFEDKWNVLYKDYNVQHRLDLLKTMPIKHLKTKAYVAKEKWKTINIKSNSDDILLNNIIMTDVIFLKESCKQIINNGFLTGHNYYIGVNKYNIDNFKKNICNAGWVETLANIFSKEEVTLRVEIYNGKIKRHGCKNYTVNVPFPVVSYLETTFGKNWRIEQ